MDFSKIKFKGKFREYQQRVLDNSERFLADGKINIVAAPGSGKTILGLELIRRLNSPCIILSPTTTIKHQWGERLKAFLPEGEAVDNYVSYDLNNIKLINSITYQALHSAINRISVDEEDFDYSNIDLFKIISEKGIKTVCLDEAHHLQNEWQKALEKFIKNLDEGVKVISLTATPPYDATPAEWERYVSVCGEIDDEIFVPELVKENTLCPHQDYVLFNYPTDTETKAFKTHRQNGLLAINEIKNATFVSKLNKRIDEIYAKDNDYIYASAVGVTAVYVFLNDANQKINKSLFYKLTSSHNLPKFDLKTAERAYQFLLDDSLLLNDDEKDELLAILKKRASISRNKVCLDLNEKLKRKLVSSCGKLNSISKIVKSEHETLSSDLRMLILTDYIKKEEVGNIGKEDIDNISVVSIFEILRKNNPSVSVGCLSGSLVILPVNLESLLAEKYGVASQSLKVQRLENTEYGIFNFAGSNKFKVDIISRLFEDGAINVLIGTQALLGEGWDSPCINSLILASFVGSFMLSNQMRGRAIRTYKNHPNKTANIWHLVTLEPEYIFESNILVKAGKYINKDNNHINSCDYEMLKRRFDCFVGPNYSTGEIESGIERITYIQPPFDKDGVEDMNDKTILLSKDRQNLASVWKNSLSSGAKTVVESVVPKELKVPAFTFQNLFMLALFGSLTSLSVVGIIQILKIGFRLDLSLLWLLVLTAVGVFMISKTFAIIGFLLRHVSPSRSFISISKGILKTFKELGLIGEGATLAVYEDDYKISTQIAIKNATLHEQNLFNLAIKELLTSINNPKYLIIKKNIFGLYDYEVSFACPTVFAKNAEIVNIFNKNLKKAIGNLQIVYTYNADGRKLLVKCRKKSFISKNDRLIKKRQKVADFR